MKRVLIAILLATICQGANEGYEIRKSFYDSGKVSYETPYKNGKQEGVAKAFYENGKLAHETSYKNGDKDGISKIYRENGKICAVFTYKKDKAIRGVWHNTNGEKEPLTKTELENWGNGKFKITGGDGLQYALLGNLLTTITTTYK
ncbi:MAG: hypothetical protein LBU73_03150 [Helicobacteraceae bacterium]|jgi:antitoxin component YwqK of YwqJK toxin-antitoxin module|nr:hypothetical protein [Helicobacteraceae bacterium]